MGTNFTAKGDVTATGYMGLSISKDATITGDVTITTSSPCISVSGKLTIDGNVTAKTTSTSVALRIRLRR